MDQDAALAVLEVSTPRRVVAALAQAGLGGVALWAAVVPPQPGPAAALVLSLLGLGALWMAWAGWRASAVAIVLTRRGLHDSRGAEIAPLGAIASVDRGFFALKPSNGFLLRLDHPMPRAWVPGVWWRAGTRVGIGGAAGARAAREMADLIALAKAGEI